jgi:hypothetical protein
MLLKAASELVGGDKMLARQLGIAETLLAKLMSGLVHLPDPLLLRAVDIVLDDRQAHHPTAPAAGALGSRR